MVTHCRELELIGGRDETSDTPGRTGVAFMMMKWMHTVMLSKQAQAFSRFRDGHRTLVSIKGGPVTRQLKKYHSSQSAFLSSSFIDALCKKSIF